MSAVTFHSVSSQGHRRGFMRVHFIENESDFRDALSQHLIGLGVQLDSADPPGIADISSWRPNADVVVLGQHPLASHLAQLSRCVWPAPVAALLPNYDTRQIMQAAKAGAIDVFDRTAPPADIAAWLHDLCQQQSQLASGDRAQSHYVSESCSAMQALQDQIERVARTDSTVLIVGETGTGKELAAREVHRIGARADRPVITVNCAAIPDTLIESELFGYEKGAFTGATSNRVGLIEAADGGTLFLDEIGELPLAAQARLLRFMQEGEIRRIGSVESSSVDVRLICSTHRNLMELENTDAFRRDLFHRINVLRLELPPLRERGNDIEGLTNWLVKRVAGRLGVELKTLSDDAYQALSDYSWPGNVRELEHTIERALVMADGNVIAVSDLNLPTRASTVAAVSALPSAESQREAPTTAVGTDTDAEELSLEDYFQRFVLENQDAMNETELAQKLGISRKCLWERRQRFGLPRQKQKRA